MDLSSPKIRRRLDKAAVLYMFSVMPVCGLLLSSMAWNEKYGAAILSIVFFVFGCGLSLLVPLVIFLTGFGVFAGVRFLIND